MRSCYSRSMQTASDLRVGDQFRPRRHRKWRTIKSFQALPGNTPLVVDDRGQQWHQSSLREVRRADAEFGHSVGPWNVDRDPRYPLSGTLRSATGYAIATLHLSAPRADSTVAEDARPDEDAANAALIRSSPLLLRALKASYAVHQTVECVSGPDCTCTAFEIVRDALAEAGRPA